MNHAHKALTALLAMAVALMYGCTHVAESAHDEGSEASGSEHARERGEGHDEGSGEEHGEEGEEDGTEYALDDTYDQVRRGVRLILAYDADTNSFIGTVENTTDDTLEQVRVEVHLSNGTELGPTPRADLAPGQSREVVLPATAKSFEGWTAHPEVGESEHS